MKTFRILALFAISFSIIYNLNYLLNEDEVAESSVPMKRTKRKIYFDNETSTLDLKVEPELFGNKTGRNNTVAMSKLLNKSYIKAKKKYYADLEIKKNGGKVSSENTTGGPLPTGQSAIAGSPQPNSGSNNPQPTQPPAANPPPTAAAQPPPAASTPAA